MFIYGNKIEFEKSDAHFIKKFGIEDAGNIVHEYNKTHNTPFVFDTYQLSKLLSTTNKKIFLLTKNIGSCYKKIIIKKKNGKDRILYSPNAALKSIQKAINARILKKIPISKYATAYKNGATLYGNAAPHVGKKYLLKMDITDFFGSISFLQVYSSVFNTDYYPKQIGAILTTLCCKDDSLPQGAPTSPALSNIVMKWFDDKLGSFCEKKEIAYTLYCDDLTFSSDLPLVSVYYKATDMLSRMGFTVNHKKTRFITNSIRQSVTGLTVNEKVAVSKGYKRDLRQEVYYALKFGFDNIVPSNSEDAVGNTVAQHLNRLLGKVNYVLQVEPENAWFLKARKELLHEKIRRNA